MFIQGVHSPMRFSVSGAQQISLLGEKDGKKTSGIRVGGLLRMARR